MLENLVAALNHYRGDLLLGWYDSWVLSERERLRLLCLRGYRRLMSHYAAVGDVENGVQNGGAAAEGDREGGDLHVDERSVLPPMSAE